MLLFHVYLSEGVRLEDARAAAAPIFRNHSAQDPVYAVGPTTLLLTERYDCLRALRGGEDYPEQATIIFTQYENNICQSERVLPPLDVQEIHYSDKEPCWLGMHLGGPMPGYQFAVVRVVGPPPLNSSLDSK